ncbi:MAG: phosphoribosylamine--glycine ligase, partial [Rhizobiaceae bacterium]|nr:phosphoribosylamine--glycine ligase [Rhizobiaceae bacterium]
MNVLLIGSGGREHAMAWKLVQSPLLETLYCAPGNAGIAQVAECLALDISDHQQIIEFCQDKDIS